LLILADNAVVKLVPFPSVASSWDEFTPSTRNSAVCSARKKISGKSSAVTKRVTAPERISPPCQQRLLKRLARPSVQVNSSQPAIRCGACPVFQPPPRRPREIRQDVPHDSIAASQRQPDVNIRKAHPRSASSPQYLPRRATPRFVHSSSGCCPVYRRIRVAMQSTSFPVVVLGHRATAGKRRPVSLRDPSLLRRVRPHRLERVLDLPCSDYRGISRSSQEFNLARGLDA
jgi:hypothetical protein